MFDKRPYPLADEIKMHVFTWLADNDFKKLPAAVKSALELLANELKMAEALKNMGIADERTDQTSVSEGRKFIAVFCQKYLEYCDMQYETPVDAATRFIVNATVQRLVSEGSSSLEYLTWFFDEFLKDEHNKQKFAPPTLKTVTMRFVIDKYVFSCRDSLKMRKRDIVDSKVKNAVIVLAHDYLTRTNDGEFGKKIMECLHGELSLRKFYEIFAAVLTKNNCAKELEKLKKAYGDATV